MELSASFIFSVFCTVCAVAMAWGMQKAKTDNLAKDDEAMGDRIKVVEHQLYEMTVNRVRQEDIDAIKKDVADTHSAVISLVALLTAEFAKRRSE